MKDNAISPDIGYSRYLMLLSNVLFAPHSEVFKYAVKSSETLEGPVSKH